MKFDLDDVVWEKIRAVLSSEPEVVKATLFGSRALGRQKPGSDIDLCIQTRCKSPEILSNLETALDDLLLPWTFDLVSLETVSDPELLDHIQRVGVTVHQDHQQADKQRPGNPFALFTEWDSPADREAYVDL